MTLDTPIIHNVAVPLAVFQESSKFFLVDEKSEKHTIVSLRTNYEFYGEKENLDQAIVVSEECLFLLANQQELFIHAFEDLFANMLEAFVKADWVLFMNTRIHFSYHIQLSSAEYKLQSDGHLLDWMHWKDHFT